MREHVLTPTQRFLKRAMDLVIAVPGLILTSPIVAIAVVVATIDTREWGIFAQERIGRWGEPFTVYKIRTMRSDPSMTSTATSSVDTRVTCSGRILRRLKTDELPQLYNVVRGDMSLVGPRPDVRGFYDQLSPPADVLLGLRPGITSPATLAFRDEEKLLGGVLDPDSYSRETLFPAKVAMNLDYLRSWTVTGDIQCILATVIPGHRAGSRHTGLVREL